MMVLGRLCKGLEAGKMVLATASAMVLANARH